MGSSKNERKMNMTEQFKTFTASDGTPIEYVDMGEGPILFNIHPYGSSTEMQLPLLNLLKDDFRCVTFSQRGWGGTPLQGDISLYQSAKDAKELIEYLGLEDAYFVGLSMGASVTFAYVAQFGCEHMKKAFIMDMTPMLVNRDGYKYGLYQGWYEEEHYQKDLKQIAEDIVTFNKYFYEQCMFQHHPEEVRTFEFDESYMPAFEKMAADLGVPVEAVFMAVPGQEETLLQYWKAMGDADFREDLKKFTVPVQLAYASPGSIYYEKTGEFVRDSIPNAKLEFFENNTHMSFLEENLPEQVALIKKFYKE